MNRLSAAGIFGRAIFDEATPELLFSCNCELCRELPGLYELRTEEPKRTKEPKR